MQGTLLEAAGGKSKLTLLSSSMHRNLCVQPYNRHFTSERESRRHRHSLGRIRILVHSPDPVGYALVPPNRFPLGFLKWNRIPNSTKIGVRWRNSVKYKFAAIFFWTLLLEEGGWSSELQHSMLKVFPAESKDQLKPAILTIHIKN